MSDWEVNEKILATLDLIIGKVSLMNLEVKGLLKCSKYILIMVV